MAIYSVQQCVESGPSPRPCNPCGRRGPPRLRGPCCDCLILGCNDFSKFSYLHTFFESNHSVARLCLHCCKGDQLFLWRSAKLGVSELRNPWTDCHKIWHGWLRRRYDPASQISNRSPQWGRPGKWVKYHSRMVFNFFLFCDHNFCSRPETKPENWFLRGLIHRKSIQGYWFPKGIKLQKIPIYPIFTHKTPPKWAWIGIFKLNAQNIKTCILSELLHRFKPNFAQWQRPPKYTSRVVQTSL